MRRLVFLAAITALAFFASPTFAQKGPLPPEKALAALKVADGFQVELFAAEPMFINPTSIDVDHKGRVWVARRSTIAARTSAGRSSAPKATASSPRRQKRRRQGDKAVTSTRARKSTGHSASASPRTPTARARRCFVCQSPDILVFEDKDGDGKADGPPKKFLTGFGGFDHDHGVHGIHIGPDGKLYFTVGDQGVHGLQSSDGKGRKWTSNNTDCQAGTVWRCDMDGKNLELIAHNFRNNYESLRR